MQATGIFVIWPRATLKGAATRHSCFTPQKKVWKRVGDLAWGGVWDSYGYGVWRPPYKYIYVYIYIYIHIYIYIYIHTYICIEREREIPYPVFGTRHVSDVIGPADCNHCNCDHILFQEMYYISSKITRLTQQNVATVVVVTVCWSHELWLRISISSNIRLRTFISYACGLLFRRRNQQPRELADMIGLLSQLIPPECIRLCDGACRASARRCAGTRKVIASVYIILYHIILHHIILYYSITYVYMFICVHIYIYIYVSLSCEGAGLASARRCAGTRRPAAGCRMTAGGHIL